MKNYACYKIEGPVGDIQRLANFLPCPYSTKNLSGQWQVLTITVIWNPTVGMKPWRKLQERFVPEGAFYYRVENLEEHRVLTNDWYRKYFDEDCLLCVTHDAGRKSKQLDELREMLVTDEFAISDKKAIRYIAHTGEIKADGSLCTPSSGCVTKTQPMSASSYGRRPGSGRLTMVSL